MFLQRVKNFVSVAVAAAFFLFALLFLRSTQITRFDGIEGERSFYLDTPSSQAVIKTEVFLSDLGRVRGESVRFACTEDGRVEEVIRTLSAKILFVEEVEGMRVYYCFTPRFSDGVRIGEFYVNLQIAVGKGVCTVGSPLIFGGF